MQGSTVWARSRFSAAKVVVAPRGRVLGGAIVGEGEGDGIAVIQFAFANGLKVCAIAARFLPAYPTRNAAVKRAVGQYSAPSLFLQKTRTAVSVLSRLP